MDFSRTYSQNSNKKYYDAKLQKVIYDAANEELEITLAGITPATAAKIWNDYYDEATGQYIRMPDAPKPTFGFQARNGFVDDPAHRYFTYYNISIAELSDEQIKGMTESYSETTLKVKATVIPTVYKTTRTTALGDKVKSSLTIHELYDDAADLNIDWETVYFENILTPEQFDTLVAEAKAE